MLHILLEASAEEVEGIIRIQNLNGLRDCLLSSSPSSAYRFEKSQTCLHSTSFTIGFGARSLANVFTCTVLSKGLHFIAAYLLALLPLLALGIALLLHLWRATPCWCGQSGEMPPTSPFANCSGAQTLQSKDATFFAKARSSSTEPLASLTAFAHFVHKNFLRSVGSPASFGGAPHRQQSSPPEA